MLLHRSIIRNTSGCNYLKIEETNKEDTEIQKGFPNIKKLNELINSKES